jgi:hypothetical protein
MKYLKYILSAVIVFSVSLFSQDGVFAPFEINQQKTNSLPSDITGKVDDAKIVDVNNAAVRQIILQKPDKISLRLPYKSGSQYIGLKKFDILAPDAKIVAGTPSGDKRIDYRNSFAAYTTDLYDKQSPLVIAAFAENDVYAMVLSGTDVYVLARLDKGNPNSDYILFQSSKVKVQRDFVCGSESFEIPERIREMQRSLSPNIKDYSLSALLKADIAIESDYETYTFFGGSVSKASNYILSLFASAAALYVRDANVRLQVTYLRVWSDINDPYPNATSSNTLLTAFRSYWNANMQSVPRALAHYIATRPGGLGGIAYINGLCASLSSGNGYAFSDVDGTFAQLPSYSWDVMVVAHETGHNFGSPHTHNCSWSGGPIDTCYVPVEGGCYNGPAIPRIGTIMSYCHLNGGISLVQGFGPLPTQLIRNNSESASCLNTVSGFFVATPNGGEIYRSGSNVYIVWGTAFNGNVNIEYTTNNGSSWSAIQNNVSASLRNFTWQSLPYMSTTTQARVRVFESGNPSNGDQSDSAFQIRPTLQNFNMVFPPIFHRVYTYQGDTTKLHFTWTKAGTLPEIKYKWNLNNFNNSINYNQFSNNNGSDTVASLTLGKLDSIAAGWGANVGDSIRGRWFVKAYSQLDSLGSSSSNFLITFVRSVIGIQPISQIIPREFFVMPNYPNPFNPVTKIRFGLPKAVHVKITVYDILGRETAVLVNENLKAGEFEADWDATDFPSGVYFYKIEAGDFVRTSRMVLVK